MSEATSMDIGLHNEVLTDHEKKLIGDYRKATWHGQKYARRLMECLGSDGEEHDPEQK